jgi:hypothetical protein
MGKKYNTTSVTAAYDFSIEPMFEVTAYEGIKPSRAKAIVRHNAALQVLEAEARADRLTNYKPKTDKIGRRPAVRECSQPTQVRSFDNDMFGWKDKVNIDISQNWEIIGKVTYCWGTYVLEEGDQGQYLVHFSTPWRSRTYGFTEWRWLKQELGSVSFAYSVEILKDLDLE